MSIKEIVESSRASQDKKELKRLLQIMVPRKPKVVVEIGVDKGFSLEVWEKAFKPKLIVGIDVVNRIEYLPQGAKFILGDSGALQTVYKVTGELKEDRIDFLFIDGNHMEPGIRVDVANYMSLVKKGGVVVFHDVTLRGNDTVQVHKVWDELKVNHDYEEFHFKGGTGTGVIYL